VHERCYLTCLGFRGFNDAVNGFTDSGWSLLDGDGGDDVTIVINSSPTKFLGSQYNASMSPTFGGVLCAKASMLLQVISNHIILGCFCF
jgi:homeobox-leucine zipper protein